MVFQEKTSQILHSFYKDLEIQSDAETQIRDVIDTAARLIIREIEENVVYISDYSQNLSI